MTSYLILHKVRGEAAYDIASPLGSLGDPECIWIIPTSGHRCYPYWVRPLEEPAIPMPDSWPDHYSVNQAKAPTLTKVDLDDLLGLSPRKDPL